MSAIEDDEVSRTSDVDVDEGEGDDLRQQEVFDSSEEEDDDDEEEIRKDGADWIVDDDNDETVKKRRHKKKHKRKENQEEDEALLDEDDLDLLMENSGAPRQQSSSKSKFKRLKRATAEEEDMVETGSKLQDFFSDDEEDQQDENRDQSSLRSSKQSRSAMDELDDFIEEDEFSDMDDEQREEARERRKQERLQPTEISGIDSDRVNELYDIFGDGEDYAWALENEEDEAGGDNQDDSRPQLQDIYEPEELKARMLTDGDKIIRDTDIPERFQEYRKNIKRYEISDAEFAHEKQWVAYMLATERNIDFSTSIDFNAAVGKVLTFIVKNNFEVPFIYSHRRDYLLKTTIVGEGDNLQTNVETLLNENDLWRISQLDIDFHSLAEKRNRVLDLQKLLNPNDEMLNNFIDNGNSVTHFQDINDYINFNYSEELKDLAPKKNVKSTIYDKIRNNRLYDLVRAIGITSGNFAANVEAASQLYKPIDNERTPKDIAEELCSDEDSLFIKSEQAVEVTKHYFAEQLYNDMRMRKYMRDLIYNSTISVELTNQGRLKIDKNSPFADLKYSINRTYLSLKEVPDFFLRMLKAESLGLIHIKFSLSINDFVDALSPLLKSDAQSELAQEWNRFRIDALTYTIKKLLPLVQLNLKEELRRECETALFYQVRSEFVKRLDQAPYTPTGRRFGDVPRVFAVTPGNGKFGQDAIIASLLDQHGKVIETYKFIENPLRKVAEGDDITFSEHFTNVLKAAEPDIIAINGFNAQTKKIFDIIKELITENDIRALERDEDGDIIDGAYENSPLLNVIFVNDEIAARYQHSQRAKDEFPDKSTLTKYTIALARYVQSPLLEYVNLKEDVTSLSIHPHQTLLPEEKLRDAIVTSFVDIVNMVGVDINQCVSNSYLASVLPYVAGLGDRKASGLLKAVQQHPLFSRQALITNPSIRIGSTVFLNCSSFLRIPQHKSSAIRANDDVELVTPLDDTRIHPEDYGLAEKMAGDALELDEAELEELKDSESGETVIDRLFAQRDYKSLLSSLILEEYSRQLETEYNKKKRATLQLILEELQEPYMDIRGKFNLLTSFETFKSLTGENETTFFDGAVIPIKVKGVGKYTVHGLTSSQIEVSTEEGCAKSRDDPRDLSLIYSFGQSVAAKIRQVDYENFKATVSFLPEDVKNPLTYTTFNRNSGFWDSAREEYDKQADALKEAKAQQASKIIQHPYFKNMNARDAETYLSHRDDGELVIRPSSKGLDHVAVTWKVTTNLYQHVDVLEKEDKDYGKYYIIGERSFKDLDEVIYEYINEMFKRVREISTHEKFRSGTREEVVSALESYSKANPQRACYSFAWNHKRPGWFLLLFKLNYTSKLQIWNVKAEPKGFSLNNYLYQDMALLCNGFKTLIKSSVNKPRQPAAYNNNSYASGGQYGDYSRY